LTYEPPEAENEQVGCERHREEAAEEEEGTKDHPQLASSDPCRRPVRDRTPHRCGEHGAEGTDGEDASESRGLFLGRGDLTHPNGDRHDNRSEDPDPRGELSEPVHEHEPWRHRGLRLVLAEVLELGWDERAFGDGPADYY